MQIRVAHAAIMAGLVVRERLGMRGVEILAGVQTELIEIGAVRLVINENERGLILEGTRTVVIAIGIVAGHGNRH